MFDEVKRARELLKGAVAALDPEVLDAGSAKELVAEFADIERVAAAGKALAARRVASSGAWRQDGDRSPAHWMARTTKTPVGAAAGLLETAARVKELPRTEQALRAGRLNEIQAREVASAAAADPAAEDELLKAAETESAAGLKECCARVRAAALSDEVARYENVRNRRRLRHWSDPDGAFRLDALLTPDAGAVVLAALGPHRDEIATAAALAGDSIIASLITNGTDVTAVDHRRREIPARLRSAVIERDRCCVVPGCDVRHGLEIDHMVPVHETCKTRLDNLARLCRWHHYLKTYRGYRLTGPPGRWRWEPPARE